MTLSDLIREVVEDILQRKTSKEKSPGQSPMADLVRPNYQRLKSQERLKQFGEAAQHPQAQHSASAGAKPDESELSSELRRTCLTHTCDQTPRIMHSLETGSAPRSEVIGRINGTSGIWWLAEPDERALTDRVRQVWDGGPLAVLVLDTATPQDALVIDEALHSLGDGLRMRMGDRGAGGGLVVGLGHPNEKLIKSQLKILAQRLGRTHLAHKDAYILENPCTFIQQVLAVSPAPAMGVLTQVPEMDGVLIAGWVYRHGSSSPVSIEVRAGWILITGSGEDVHKVLDGAKWYRERLRG